MNVFDQTGIGKVNNPRATVGMVLIIAGAILFMDRYLQTGWLSLIVLPSVGLFLFGWGIRWRSNTIILAGGLLGGMGAGGIAAFAPIGEPHPLLTQIGLVSLFTGLGWLAVLLATYNFTAHTLWWAIVPGGVLTSLGSSLVFTSQNWPDFVLYLSVGLGIALLVWGLGARLFGLTIPGCLLLGAGAGIYLAWRPPVNENWLVQIGVMLVWFALGWLLITVSGRIIMQRYLWWPLIPCGILAVVGWGLYIGGDPDNALGFISNTGSIGLMIFGLYLLLMRKGIHH
jgi:hypothetical protein